MKGLFITFEGTEGSGKSTQIITLFNRLRALGYAVRVLREPGGKLSSAKKFVTRSNTAKPITP